MSYMHLTVFAALILFCICFLKISTLTPGKDQSSTPFLPTLLFLIALVVRLLFAVLTKGFNTDIVCFASWADRMYQVGPGGFYSVDVFTDYPPGYMYLLWPIGALRSILQIEYLSAPHLLLLKTPAIACDLACGFLLYREAKRICPHRQAFILCAVYLFNPAVILNSSLWGQVDSISTLCMACMVLCLVKDRLVPSYAAFFIALLFKPQALFLAPILFVGILNQVILKDFSVMNLLRHFFYCVTIFCGTVLLCAPFGLDNVAAQYLSTVGSYAYASVNAYNFWAMVGLNWASQSNTFMGIPYYAYGYCAIAAAVAATLAISVKNRHDRKIYPMLSALMLVSIFLFSVRMHERYLYPALFFLLLTYLYKPSPRLFLCYGGFTLLHFYNTAHVLYYYDPHNYDRNNPIFLLVGMGMMLMAFLFYHTVARLYVSRRISADWTAESMVQSLPSVLTRPSSPGLKPEPSARMPRLKIADLICMLVITALYSCIALYDLGDRQAPVSFYSMTQNQVLELDFGENAPRSLSYYIGPQNSRVFALEGRRTDRDYWAYLGDISLDHVFTWESLSIEAGVPQLKLTLQDNEASLIELVFLDEAGNVITPVNAVDYPALFDEQSLFPEHSSFRNSMYFDEIYHARTAYEFLRGLYSYENTHPPLGKILIAAGVAVFGMNPFGWRIVGTLFGIAMVPLIYLLARRVTMSTPGAALTCVLFTFDFMHFTQTRIATIDVYITFFVILMYYFMYCYSRMSFYDTPLTRTLIPLGACGVCMGLGIATKWTGVYAGAGLAVIFFATLHRRYREYLWAKDRTLANTSPQAEVIRARFEPYAKKTILFCMVFFVVIPAGIYLLSYLPFRDNTTHGLILRMLDNQSTMFRYHSRLDATHSYSSPWYQWPLIIRPTYFFSGSLDGNLREGISTFGNPFVWWAGIPAFFYMANLWIKEKDRTAAFLTIGYLSQYLPWVFVTRITFIYHYFPSVVFVVLMIAYGLMKQRPKLSNRRFFLLLALYGASVIGLFLLFYPVLAGQPIDADFIDRWLRWFDSWTLAPR